jgi:tetratricopeptide (TPR) repeat protein
MVRSALCLAVLLAAAGAARADEPPPPGPAVEPPPPSQADVHLAKARDFMAARDFARTRDELLVAYRLEPRAELLFALGQVEFNLGHYQDALDYYQRFAATNPTADQAALAQQAIGAARFELERAAPVAPPPPLPLPPPPPPPLRVHDFDVLDRGVAAVGGLAIVAGAASLVYGHHLAEVRTGTLHDYDLRIKHAQIAEWSGRAALGAGTIAVAIALIRWRIHLVETTLEVHPIEGGVSITLARPL